MSHIRLEALQPIDGVFILDRSTLGGTEAMVTTASEGTAWEAIECDSTGMSVTRGGAREGLGTKIEVGTLNASFVDGVNPLDDPDLRPGVPVRLIEDTTDATLFTGQIDRFAVNYDKQDDRSYISMTALDAVSRLASTPRNGADGPEPWQARFARLLKSSSVPYVAPAQIEPTTWWEVEDLEGEDQVGMWSGGWEVNESGYLLRTDLSGAASSRVIECEKGRVLYVRVSLAVETGSPTDITATTDAPLDARSVSSGTGWVNYSFIICPNKDTFTLTVQGPAGRVYGIESVEIEARPRTIWAAPIVHQSDLASHLDIAANSAGVGWYVDAEGTVRISEGDGETVAHFSDVHDADDPLHVCYTQADVSYDTAEATNTIRFANHSRKHNGVTITVPTAPPPGTLTRADWTTWTIWDDNATPVTASRYEVSVDLLVSHPTTVQWWGNAGTMETTILWPGRWYTITHESPGTSLARFLYFRPTQDTGPTVTLATRNLSIRAVGKNEADDTTLGAFMDHAAAATWGERAEELETAIFTGTPYDSMGEGIEDQAAWLAQRLLARHSRPEPTVSSLTFDALKYPDIAAGLDIQMRVSVTHRSLTQTTTIVGISHEITPNDWFITLTLMEA
ncbi:hypothetical protein [Demequina litorisediminis]|uniref:Minor tail protein n=1 Tax=Demequina litorisediminis TaxID=1849022 RepID=A0ABQ6IBB5_9MICO|nr:hypothetical protein [Demequina litorisediminis]GMA34746.1 hypothetical protein GCM10025876_09500 [Demequina litorisediminis]